MPKENNFSKSEVEKKKRENVFSWKNTVQPSNHKLPNSSIVFIKLQQKILRYVPNISKLKVLKAIWFPKAKSKKGWSKAEKKS